MNSGSRMRRGDSRWPSVKQEVSSRGGSCKYRSIGIIALISSRHIYAESLIDAQLLGLVPAIPPLSFVQGQLPPVSTPGREHGWSPPRDPPPVTLHGVGPSLNINEVPLTNPPMSCPPISGWPNEFFPQTPPATTQTPPWISQNGFVPEFPISPPVNSQGGFIPQRFPVSPDVNSTHGRERSNSSKTSMSRTHTRQRTWSVAVDEVPGGGIKATGLVADDGTFIQHGRQIDSEQY